MFCCNYPLTNVVAGPDRIRKIKTLLRPQLSVRNNPTICNLYIIWFLRLNHSSDKIEPAQCWWQTTDCEGMFSDVSIILEVQGEMLDHSAGSDLNWNHDVQASHFTTWSPLIAQIRSSFSQSSQLCSRLSVVSETVFVQWVLTVNKNQRLTCWKYLQRVEFKGKFLWREVLNL